MVFYDLQINSNGKLKVNNSLHLVRKFARIFAHGYYPFRDANSSPRVRLEENCELQGTDNVLKHIYKYMFESNGAFCAYFPSIILAEAYSMLLANQSGAAKMRDGL